MQRFDRGSLWQVLSVDARLPQRRISGAVGTVPLASLADGSCLGGHLQTLRGRCVLLATGDQLTAALALIELDGIAARIVLCPPDAPAAHLPAIAAAADVNAVVSDGIFDGVAALDIKPTVVASPNVTPSTSRLAANRKTEWVLLTSGTTGEPKLVLYTRTILAGAIKPAPPDAACPIWSTFYDIRRYGGLQIFLRALLTGGSMVLSEAHESVAAFLARAGACGVTHISGTPSHWRRAIMSGAAQKMSPAYVRLSGEIADQTVLDALARTYPDASVAHAFASTEAGVAFDVGDGRAGFPAYLIGASGTDVEMKIDGGSLRIRSPRTAIRYLGAAAAPLKDADGFVDTGDIVERHGDRYLFAGRRGGVINVGGAKVYPEEVEDVLNRHPAVEASRAFARKSAFTGAIVAAEIVVRASSVASTAGPSGDAALQANILEFCRAALPPHKVPAVLRLVPVIEVSPSGKLVRRHV